MASRLGSIGVIALASLYLVSPAHADPLHDAAWKGDIGQVKRLIANDAHVNAKDKNGDTPLHTAALRGHTAVAKVFIAKGADVNAKDKDGDTPLDGAASPQMVKLLKQHGAKK